MRRDYNDSTNSVTTLSEQPRRSDKLVQLVDNILKMQLIVFLVLLSYAHATQRRYAPFLIEDASGVRTQHNRAAGTFTFIFKFSALFNYFSFP